MRPVKELHTLHVNGDALPAPFEDSKTLRDELREKQDRTGTKHGSEMGASRQILARR